MLGGYKYAVDNSVVQPLVFELVQNVLLYGLIGSIQVDLFKLSTFKQLRSIQIAASSLSNFFYQVGLEWTVYLNNSNALTIVVAFSQAVQEIGWLNSGGYTYPNKDLCLFASLPLRKQSSLTEISVLPLLNTKLSSCTDPIAWLTQNYHLFDLQNVSGIFNNLEPSLDFSVYPFQIYISCWSGLGNNKPNITQIEANIKQCKINPNELADGNNHKIYTDDYDFETSFQFTVNLLAFILVPLACIAGFFLNAQVKARKAVFNTFSHFLTHFNSF
jgi:hypothetical protein